MPLREYRRDYVLGRAVPPQRIQGRIAGAAAAIVGLIVIGVALALKSRAVTVPTGAATLCPTDRPLSSVTVILLDVSDRFSEPQRLQIQNHLARLRDSVPRFGLIEVYTVDRLGRRVTEPVFHLCNPGTGDDLNRIYQNPELARKRWHGFADTLAADIDRQVSLPATATSPIFEAIQATAVRTFGRPEYDGLPKRLVIVSDLLQNVPGGLNMYQGIPSFRAFRRTPYFSQVRADLSGVVVAIYYLARSGVGTQGRRHLGFWDAYFRFQGARVESAVGVFGDR
ncbi:MAG TPA: hypothetical protein VHH32_04645 [Gemmatimonadales bacterium]|nr:hypothetical protein [Gemmatimonadales bacterium]